MKISVIIPAYNAEPYIAKAIESCLEQTLPPDEIIVADDCSTDRTAEIAASFPAPVRVLRLERNSGVSVARNRAAEVSTGDWLTFLDADDWFLPRKLELQRRCVLENPNAVLVYTGHRLVAPDGSEKDCPFYPPEQLHWRLRYHCAFHVGSVMLRRDALDTVGEFDPDRCSVEDWDMWLRVADRFSAAAFAAVPEPLTAYRQTPGSLSSNAMQMYTKRTIVIDSRSLYGISGLSRSILRRKIHAFNCCDTAVALREQGSAEYLDFMLRSLALWPFPNRMLTLKRYRAALVMLLQYFGLWSNPFRSGNDAAMLQGTNDR